MSQSFAKAMFEILFRPFRAKHVCEWQTQGVALGFILPLRWSWSCAEWKNL